VCVYVANYKELIIIERRQKVRAHSSIGQRRKRSQSVSNINDEIRTDNMNACHIHITDLQSEIWLICYDKIDRHYFTCLINSFIWFNIYINKKKDFRLLIEKYRIKSKFKCHSFSRYSVFIETNMIWSDWSQYNWSHNQKDRKKESIRLIEKKKKKFQLSMIYGRRLTKWAEEDNHFHLCLFIKWL
jgi:hypothetical protein